MSHPLCYTKIMKMKNDELNKAFDNFHKALNNALDAIEDFHSLDINKTSEPTLETQRDEGATDFIVTTTNGTRWSAKAVSVADAWKNFFGTKIGLTILKVEKGQLFTHEESEELRREKIELSCR